MKQNDRKLHGIVRNTIIMSGVLLFALVAICSCSRPWGEYDNPADINSSNFQGFEVADNPNGIKAYFPADMAVFFDSPPSEFVVSLVTGAEAYQLQISTTSGFDAPLVLDRSDFSSNKMVPGSLGLVQGQTYSWRSRAKKAGSWGVTWTVIRTFSIIPTYTVTYDGNGNTGGSVPMDGNRYPTGSSVTVVGNTGSLSKTGYDAFAGWNTAANGSGTDRAVGSTFAMGSVNVTLYAKWYKIYNVGDTGPAGGLVFYDKGSYSSGWRYMEAAPSDQSSGIVWWKGIYIPTGARATEIGSGRANTTAIIAAQGAGSYAASLCANLVLGGYDDWFLPSKDELNLMYNNLKVAGRGSFAPAWYWSSSEYTYGIYDGHAWPQDFGGSSAIAYQNGYMSNTYYVRAVRAY